MTTAAASATARGVSTTVAPASRAALIAPGSGSQTTRACPAASSRAAIRPPIAPNPTKPTGDCASGVTGARIRESLHRLHVDALLGQRLLGDAKRVHPRRDPAVDG